MSTPNIPLIKSLQQFRRISTYARTSGPYYEPTEPPNNEAYLSTIAAAGRAIRPLIVDEELSLTTLRALSTTSSTTSMRAKITANTELAQIPSYLPPAGSPLPTILAYRLLSQTIASTTASLSAAKARLEKSQQRLKEAQTLVAEQQALHDALTARLMSPAPTMSAEVDFARQTAKLTKRIRTGLKALRAFTQQILTPLLELEESGGPVTGTVEAEVETGNKTQRTLREMWEKRREGEGGDGDGEGQQGVSEEMQELLEGLMNASAEGGDGGWLRVRRESASVRYLVRSGVAVMDRKDAERVRLRDFGGTVE